MLECLSTILPVILNPALLGPSRAQTAVSTATLQTGQKGWGEQEAEQTSTTKGGPIWVQALYAALDMAHISLGSCLGYLVW